MKQPKTSVLFSSGPLSVTSNMLRFRGRRYKLIHLENTILKRPLFFMALAMAALLIGSVLFNADILYFYESLIGIAAALLLLVASWPFGTMYIHSRTLSTGGGSITWLYGDLARAQNAIEDILERNGHSSDVDLFHKDNI